MFTQCLFQLAPWKTPFSNVTIIFVEKTNSKCVLSRSVFLSTESMLHYPFYKQFFHIVSSCLQKSFESKVWCVQVPHLHSAVRTIWSPSRCFQLSTNLAKISFVIFDIVVKKQIKCGLTLSVLLLTMSTHHHSGQNLLTHSAVPCESTTFSLLWWRIRVINKSTNYAKSHWFRFVKSALCKKNIYICTLWSEICTFLQ